MPNSRSTASRMAMAACLLAVTLSACQKSGSNGNSSDNGQPATAPPIAALPLATAAPTAPMAYAPAATALPSGPSRVRIGLRHDRERYGYTDRAYAMSSAFGDTPPDYTVAYEGTRPWVWRSNDGGYRVVEQLPDGQRTYYYKQGADSPFYITDPDGGYAYDGDSLVGIYSPDGTPLSDNYAQQWAGNAARYYDRSREIYHAVQYSQRQAAYADDWRARRDRLAQQQQRWDGARSRDSDWQSWHDQHQQDESRTWQGEQDRRAAYAVAIGAAIVGTAVLGSGNHAGGGQNQSAPPAAFRPNDAARTPAPTFGGGYGQRPNTNSQPAANREASGVQGPTAPAVQRTGARPVGVQSPQGAWGNHSQNQPQRQAVKVTPQVPVRASMPARQNAVSQPTFAPTGAPAARTQAFVKPQIPVPSAQKRPLAEPLTPAVRRPLQPAAVTRPPFEGAPANAPGAAKGGAAHAPQLPARPTATASNRPYLPAIAPASVSARPHPNGVAPVPVADRGHHAPPADIKAVQHRAPNKADASQRKRPNGQPATELQPRN